jgi:hypothetical protein
VTIFVSYRCTLKGWLCLVAFFATCNYVLSFSLNLPTALNFIPLSIPLTALCVHWQTFTPPSFSLWRLLLGSVSTFQPSPYHQDNPSIILSPQALDYLSPRTLCSLLTQPYTSKFTWMLWTSHHSFSSIFLFNATSLPLVSWCQQFFNTIRTY